MLVKPVTIADSVYEQIRHDIIHLHLAPGERLSEASLAERYQVGRAPIRVALRRLNEEWARQDGERKTQLAIEKAKMERMKKLREMSDDERKAWLDIHKEELEKEEREAFEKQAKEQADLREFVDGLKKKDLEKAEAAIEEAKTKEKNEYQKMVEEKAKDGTPPPRGEMLKKDVEAAKKEAEKKAADAKKDEPAKPAAKETSAEPPKPEPTKKDN